MDGSIGSLFGDRGDEYIDAFCDGGAGEDLLDDCMSEWIECRFGATGAERKEISDTIVARSDANTPRQLREKVEQKRARVRREMKIEEGPSDAESKELEIDKMIDDPDASVEVEDVDSESLFFLKSGGESKVDFTRDREISEILSMLCLDKEMRRQESFDSGVSFGLPEQYSEEELLSSLSTEIQTLHGKERGLGEMISTSKSVYDILINPSNCDWSNHESVVSWIMIANNRPLDLIQFFQDPDELMFFLWEIWKRGSCMYSILVNSEHVRGWSIHALLLLLQSNFLNEFKEYVKIIISNSARRHFTINRPQRSNVGPRREVVKTDLFKEFSKNNLFLTMRFGFSKLLYQTVYARMGIVVSPQRPIYKMDLTDLSLTLTCISKTWRSWDFWFGYKLVKGELRNTLMRDKNKKPHRPISVIDEPMQDSQGNGLLTSSSLSSRDVQSQIKSILKRLEVYIYWIYFRFVECLAADWIDLTTPKTKENVIYITGMLGLFQTLIDFGLSAIRETKRVYTLEDFVVSVFKSDSVNGKRKLRCKINLSVTKLSNIREIASALVNEGRELSRRDLVSDNITALIMDLCKPIHSTVMYQSRQCGMGLNVKSALREMNNRSLVANLESDLVMNQGNIDSIEKVLTEDNLWFINHAMQLQAVKSYMMQYVASLDWTKRFMIRDQNILNKIKDRRAWPEIEPEKRMTKSVKDVMEEIGLRNMLEKSSNPDGSRDFSFKSLSGISGVEGNVIVQFGCFYITYGYGFSFVSPCFFEAFYAWTMLQYAFWGWSVFYPLRVITQDKRGEKKIMKCDIETPVKLLITGDFAKSSSVQKGLDEVFVNRLTRTTASSNQTLTEKDINLSLGVETRESTDKSVYL